MVEDGIMMVEDWVIHPTQLLLHLRTINTFLSPMAEEMYNNGRDRGTANPTLIDGYFR